MKEKPPALVIMAPPAYAGVFPETLQARLGDLLHLPGPYLQPEQWQQMLLQRDPLLEHCKVLVTSWGMPTLDDASLERLPALQGIFHAAGSVKFIEAQAIWERDITVVSAAEANAIPVVEYCLSVIIFSLKLGWHQMKQMRGQMTGIPLSEIPGCYRKKVGIVSFGLIGQRLVQRLRETDLECLVYDPFASVEEIAAAGAQKVGLADLFAEADVVSIHTPLLAETRHLIQGAHLLAMKPHGVLLNTSRGEVIAQDEMIAALQERPDLTAILDVTSPEPLPEGHALFSMENVILTPHIAGSMGSERQRLGEYILRAIQQWQTGQPVAGNVAADAFLRMA